MTTPAALSCHEKLGYGAGDLGCNMVWQMTTAFLLFFYTDVFGITASAVGTLLLVARVFDAVNDPVMGLITERVRTRWGKFRHYLLFGAPALGIFLVLTFSTPDLSPSGKLVYAYISYIGLGVVYTATNLPYGALAATMTQDPGERNSLSVLRTFGAIAAATLVGMATPALVTTFGKGDPSKGFQLVAVAFAVVGLAGLWLTFATSRERYVAPQLNKMSFADLLATVSRNRPFILLAIAVLFIMSAGFIRLAAPPFYVIYNLKQPGLLGPFLGLGSVSILVGLFAGQFLAPRLGKRNIFVLGALIVGLASLALFITAFDDVAQVLVWYAIGSLGFGFSFALMWSMISDTVEYSEWQSGIRAEGGVYSIASFVTKLASAVAGALPAMILARTAYVPNVEQTELAQSGINWMMCLVPALLALLAIVPMLFYKLDEKSFARVVAELEARK